MMCRSCRNSRNCSRRSKQWYSRKKRTIHRSSSAHCRNWRTRLRTQRSCSTTSTLTEVESSIFMNSRSFASIWACFWTEKCCWNFTPEQTRMVTIRSRWRSSNIHSRFCVSRLRVRPWNKWVWVSKTWSGCLCGWSFCYLSSSCSYSLELQHSRKQEDSTLWSTQ